MAEGDLVRFTIEELTIPETVDDDFAEMVRVRNEIEAAAVGNWDLAIEPAELFPTGATRASRSACSSRVSMAGSSRAASTR